MSLPGVEALTRELVDIPSTTGNEEAVVLRLRELLVGLGFDVTLQEIAPARPNLLATRSGHEPRVIFCSHTDTVPPHIPSREDADAIHGRGACDTKGVIASMLHAGAALVAGGTEDVGYLFLVGEEVDHVGARRAGDLGLKPAACIVGEPTDCKLATAQKGLLKATLRASGLAGHSGYPTVGRSAVHALVASMNRLLVHPWPSRAKLGDTTLNFGRVEGGVAANVFAPEAEAHLLMRLAMPYEAAIEQLRDLVALDADVEVEIVSGNDPVDLVTLPGFAAEPVAFNTDIAYLGFPTNLLYGPGTIQVAHSDHEHVPKAQLHEAVETYQRLVNALL